MGVYKIGMVWQTSEAVLGHCSLKPLTQCCKFLDWVCIAKLLRWQIDWPDFLAWLEFKEPSFNLRHKMLFDISLARINYVQSSPEYRILRLCNFYNSYDVFRVDPLWTLRKSVFYQSFLTYCNNNNIIITFKFN